MALNWSRQWPGRVLLSLWILSLFSTFAAAMSTKSTLLIIAKDSETAKAAHSGLQGYAIPYRVLMVPQGGVTLPQLNSSATQGNFGGFVILSDVSYNYTTATGSAYRSAITDPQWEQMFAYQRAFKVRMVRLDVYPGPKYGTVTAIDKTGCCNAGVEQLISISNDTAFKTAHLKTYAGVSTTGLFHFPARITDPSWTFEFAAFEPSGQYKTRTTAGVINTNGNREQMAFFITWGTDWSATSTYLQHSWIAWITRGLYSGFRRVYLSTQVDDMFLVTDLYEPQGSTFRLRPADLEHHITWQQDLNRRLPRGSNYMLEIGHNGNGDIEAAVALNIQGVCNPIEAIEYADQVDTVLEYIKTPGTGVDIWPATPQTYRWSATCANLDPLMQWFRNPTKRDAFMHVSHTFTHEALNNATYSDAAKEISFNRAWFQQAGISAARKFSPGGLIPPAITGLHNADVIKAWMDNGIRNVVGDNTRDILRNQQNKFWPAISNRAVNGYAGLVIIPRWATTIYYNCDLPSCTLNEWINTSGGSGDYQTLLDDARQTNSKWLLGLHWDPFMFHQANLRVADVPATMVNGVRRKLSLIETWTEVVAQEMTRLTDWPLITLKHDDIATAFVNRMNRDQCSPQLTWNYNSAGTAIESVTLNTIQSNRCGTEIPITVPGGLRSTPSGSRTEKIGSDSLTVWVKMNGAPVTVQLDRPLQL